MLNSFFRRCTCSSNQIVHIICIHINTIVTVRSHFNNSKHFFHNLLSLWQDLFQSCRFFNCV
ncbi:SWIM zinc finger family protein [Phocaeicola plebeius]|uniref:SWIM zinc finger family protein n=1 Tax=Phocaeicola plebeius TaxID=310297 RepID=UPI0034E944F8